MKNFTISEILSLVFIAAIGFFELFYRHNLIDGWLVLGMAFGLLVYHFCKKGVNE